jgi:ureidoglycolate lyase
MRRIAPQPLTGLAFAAFGEVVEHAGQERRRKLTNPFDIQPEASRFSMWVSRANVPARLPLLVGALERHRSSAQTFIPLSPVHYLVVVAPSNGDGAPDPMGLKAFIAGPGQGVSYRKDTWHHGLTVLDQSGDFAVMMGLRGDGKDDEFVDLPDPIEVVDRLRKE